MKLRISLIECVVCLVCVLLVLFYIFPPSAARAAVFVIALLEMQLAV